MTNVQVQCCHCKGEGEVPDYRVRGGKFVNYLLPTDPFLITVCPTCNGFGVVIATELKAVTAWEQVRPAEKRNA